MAENSTRKTWVTILIAMAAISCVVGVTLAGSAAYFFASHAHSIHTSLEDGQAKIAEAKARFGSQTAMIVFNFGEHDPVVNLPPPDAHGAPISVVRALIYSQPEGKVIDMSLPVWMLHMLPTKQFNFYDDSFVGSDRVRLTFADVERHGPGLIVDGFDRKGSRVLVWAE